VKVFQLKVYGGDSSNVSFLPMGTNFEGFFSAGMNLEVLIFPSGL